MERILSGAEKAVLEQTSKLNGELLELSRSLIRIPSEITPCGGSEGAAQQYFSEYLSARCFDVLDIFTPTEVKGIEEHPGWWPGQLYEGRPNVVAIRKGSGSGRSLILNGHMDTVPTGDPGAWRFSPFSAHVHEGELYGRGACDMKAGLALMAVASEAIRRSGITLAGDLILESVVNEETGVYNGTLACCARGYSADGAVVLEPTGLDLCRGIKGNRVYEAMIPGKATHNCLWWEGSSAFDHAVFFKEGLLEYQKIRALVLNKHPLYGDKRYFKVPALVDDIWSVQIGSPHMFSVPDKAILTFMVEILPGEDPCAVTTEFEKFMLDWCSNHPYLKEHLPEFRFPDFRPIYPVEVPLSHPLVQCFTEAILPIRPKGIQVRGFESACDAMTLMMWGDTPAIIYGPGNLRNAHEIDEKVSIVEMERALEELCLFILRFCGISD